MIAVENIELYRYEIHSLLKAFYPQETVKVFVGEPDLRKYPDPAFLRAEFSKNYIEMALLPEGAPEGEARGPLIRKIEAPPGTAFDQKSPACKNAAKHMLYEMLSEYTGTTLPWGELIGIRPTKIAMGRLSLYVGIPFCPTTCLYCSFTSFPLTSWRDRVDEYLDALEREMEASAPLMEGRILDTLYIGGGTPTTLEPSQSRRLIGMIRQYFDLSALQEFTVEAGRPDSIDAEKLAVLKECGVGRISVNPQTMRDSTLKLIGRQHSAAQTEEAFRLAREEGFDNINMDIILGLPGETRDDVQYTIDKIRELGPDDLTVHSLAIKRASRLQKWIGTWECIPITSTGRRTCPGILRTWAMPGKARRGYTIS